MFGIYGKHPAFGDFISHGISSRFQNRMEPWLGQILAEVRNNLGPSWQTVFDSSLPIRFWIGSRIFGKHNLRGVMMFSHDKVGRRFPLIFIEEKSALPCPVLNHDQSFFDNAQICLTRELQCEKPDFPAILSSKDDTGEDTGANTTETDTLWATNPDPQIEGLLQAVCAADHQRAAEYRSYWWCVGQKANASVFLTTQGLPDSAELSWLLSGMRKDSLQYTPVPENSGNDAPKESLEYDR